MSSAEKSSDELPFAHVLKAGGTIAKLSVQLLVFVAALSSAYYIRMYAINDYGPIIHEFDPWFNFRATQYYADNGWEKFFTWFDYMSWYPLGRPVGSTIYPGMQITSVWIWRAFASLVARRLASWSIPGGARP